MDPLQLAYHPVISLLHNAPSHLEKARSTVRKCYFSSVFATIQPVLHRAGPAPHSMDPGLLPKPNTVYEDTGM